MKRLNITTLIALFAFSVAGAKAGEVCCPPPCKTPCCAKTGYVFGYIGHSFDYEQGVTEAGIPFSLEHDGDYMFGAGAGIYSDLLGGTRFEIEGIRLGNDFQVFFGGAPNGQFGDTVETFAVMVNALKEIPLETPFGCITAYGGGGAGYAWTDISLNNGNASSDEALALQLIAGADLPISDCISLFTQYKLLFIDETDYNLGGVRQNADDVLIHSVQAGIRYSF